MGMLAEQPSIKRNYYFNLIYQIFSASTQFITGPYLSRVLGPEGVGVQSYTNSIQYYFLLFAILGTMDYGAREISRNRDSRENYSRAFWEIECVTVITSGICLIAWILFLLCSSEYRLYYIVLIPNLLSVMVDITWFYNGLERIHIIAVRNALFKTLNIVLIFLLVRGREDAALGLFINSCIAFASALSLWLGMRGMVDRPAVKLQNCWKRFQETLIYFLPTIAISIYSVLDKTMIGVITGADAQNGYYEEATKLINTIKMVAITVLNSVMGVHSAYLFKQQKMDEIKWYNDMSVNYTLFFGVGSMFGLFAVAKDFVPIFFGPGYDEVTVLLYILSPIVPVIGISSSLGTHYYTPGGYIKEATSFLMTGAATNVILNIFLIRTWSARGAAVASVMAEVVNTCLYISHCQGFFTYRDLMIALWKKLVAGFIMLAAIRLLPFFLIGNKYLSLVLEVLLGVAVYLVALLLLKDYWTTVFVQTCLKKLQKQRGGNA